MARKKKVGKAAPKEKEIEIDETEFEDSEEIDEEEAPKKRGASKSKESAGSVYKVIELVGSSDKSWEHAAQIAIEKASQTLEELRIAEVVDQDLKIEDGKIAAYRTKLRLSFKFRD